MNELEKKIDTLETENDELKKEIVTLKAENKEDFARLNKAKDMLNDIENIMWNHKKI